MGPLQMQYTYVNYWCNMTTPPHPLCIPPLPSIHTQWKLKSHSVVMHIVRDMKQFKPYYTTWFSGYDWLRAHHYR